MRRVRQLLLFAAPILLLLVFADPALAITHGGEGTYGSTDDVSITNTMFILIGFFPAVIIVFSFIQGWFDHRRHKKLVAEKAARAQQPVEGGW